MNIGPSEAVLSDAGTRSRGRVPGRPRAFIMNIRKKFRMIAIFAYELLTGSF
jgi:hypothetical protein